MRFKVPCLVAHPGVAGRVGLVEGVLCELSPVPPDLFKYLDRVAMLLASVDELVVEGFEDVQLLFSHGFTQLVGLAFGEACELLGQQHDLLLVYRDAVCVLQEFLHFRQVVLYFFSPLFPGYE